MPGSGVPVDRRRQNQDRRRYKIQEKTNGLGNEQQPNKIQPKKFLK